jgi:hypothetical protein
VEFDTSQISYEQLLGKLQYIVLLEPIRPNNRQHVYMQMHAQRCSALSCSNYQLTTNNSRTPNLRWYSRAPSTAPSSLQWILSS